MQPEVEKLLNQMRENKRKNDELNILIEKIRKEEVYNIIQANKDLWEAQERFNKECGKRIYYNALNCPTCKMAISSVNKSDGRYCCVECKSCNEILNARNDFYVNRIQSEQAEKKAKKDAEELKRKAEEAQKKLEETLRNAEAYRVRTDAAIIANNEKLGNHFNNAYVKNTFTEIIFGKPSSELLVLDKNNIWSHWEIQDYGDSQKSCTSGMNSEWKNYYSEGKVPFMTSCPICNKSTTIQYHSRGGSNDLHLKNQFTEVMCSEHYKYDSLKNEHYKWQIYPSRAPLLDMYGRSIDFRPTGPSGHWVIWDPTDPDGSRAAAEKIKKDNEDICRQIEILKSKLM
jgi:hypothetical protein